ncbi:MAG: DUF4371 domain-containing protein, partial [Pseudomonadota bacterium]
MYKIRIFLLLQKISGMDRHKCTRQFESGAAKRKASKERAEKEAQELSKTRRLTEFFTCPPVSTSKQTDTHRNPSTGQSEQGPAGKTPAHSSGDGGYDQNDVSDLKTDSSSLSKQVNQQTTAQHNDIGLWPEKLTKEFVDYWAVKGAEDLQYSDAKILDVKSATQTFKKDTHDIRRKCTPAMFERKNPNGELVKRSWLCFSPSNGKIYCFFCKLMGATKSQFTDDGFCDWKHASNRLIGHEQSKDHLQAVLSAAGRAREAGSIDSKFELQVNQIEQYWRSVLRRLVSVLKFACERGLALRGDDENIGSPHNGNYLGLLELLSEYDDFLKQHIRKLANCGSGHTNYLSSTICEELVTLMGNEVLNEIISRIKLSKYYSISLDSTPDEGHVDQLSVIFRYMEHDAPVERFVKFLPNQGHKAQE